MGVGALIRAVAAFRDEVCEKFRLAIHSKYPMVGVEANETAGRNLQAVGEELGSLNSCPGLQGI